MLQFKLRFTAQAKYTLTELKNDSSKKGTLKAILKTLSLVEHNLRHPSLNTHEYHSFKGPHGEKVFEAYAQQHTPGAYRIFWYYGPEKGTLTITLITPHPNKHFN